VDISAPGVQGQIPERIVTERPRLYSLKRDLNPISWLEAGVSPLMRLMERLAPTKNGSAIQPAKAPKIYGVKFNVKGMGNGSGFGPEVKPFHDNVFNSGVRAELPLLVTYRVYESFGFRVERPLAANGIVHEVNPEFVIGYMSRASDNFFGVGNESLESDEARFRSVSRVAGGALTVYMSGVWMARLEEGYRSIGITQPRGYRSVTDTFSPADVPGLSDSNGTMLSTRVLLERSTRDQPYVPGAGGLQRFEVIATESLTGGDFSYWKYRVDLQQFVPLTKDRRNVLGLRGGIETNQPRDGNVVPFYDMPIIGSFSTVRGFANRRFTDNSALSVSADYRYRIWQSLDWGFFLDAGQVGNEIGDFGLNQFHYGYGARLIGRLNQRAVSLDVARSREGWRVYFNVSPPF
jgi:hypothetical protein